jgi:hypothetical protein
VISGWYRWLQAPFLSGVRFEYYLLEPIAARFGRPRVRAAHRLLRRPVQTIEAGRTAALELLLRRRASRIIVKCRAGLAVERRHKMAEKFGLDFTVGADLLQHRSRNHGYVGPPSAVAGVDVTFPR